MLLGRISGRPVVAYESMDKAICKKSCIACTRYRDILPCRFYAHCRASKLPTEDPIMFNQATNEVIYNRMTPVSRSELDGLQPCCV